MLCLCLHNPLLVWSSESSPHSPSLRRYREGAGLPQKPPSLELPRALRRRQLVLGTRAQREERRALRISRVAVAARQVAVQALLVVHGERRARTRAAVGDEGLVDVATALPRAPHADHVAREEPVEAEPLARRLVGHAELPQLQGQQPRLAPLLLPRVPLPVLPHVSCAAAAALERLFACDRAESNSSKICGNTPFCTDGFKNACPAGLTWYESLSSSGWSSGRNKVE